MELVTASRGGAATPMFGEAYRQGMAGKPSQPPATASAATRRMWEAYHRAGRKRAHAVPVLSTRPADRPDPGQAWDDYDRKQTVEAFEAYDRAASLAGLPPSTRIDLTKI